MNKKTVKEGDYEIDYITNNEDGSVKWTIFVKGEGLLTSTAVNFKEAVEETNELTKPE